MIDGKEFFITGGCGTLGKELICQLKRNYNPRGIRIYSRDEYKHLQAKAYLLNQGITIENIAFIIGDIRDYSQLKRAMQNVDIVIHTAALKQVPACEDNPIEAQSINVVGAQNIMIAAWENEVEQVVNIATDKGVYPVNIYGITKSLAEKSFIFGAIYTGKRKPYFKSCRYGNVIGSRGSVIPVWKQQVKETGKIKMTNREMTRFFIPLSKVAKFVIDRLHENETGKIYIPKMKSIQMGELADMLFPGVPQQEIGIRPGEKIHETIITAEESIFAKVNDNYYVIDAYAMKIKNQLTQESELISYGLDSYNNPERWGEEILKYCEVNNDIPER